MAGALMTWKCNSCGGSYADTQGSGFVYMHVCPPTVSNGVGGQTPTFNPRDETPLVDSRGDASDIRHPGSGVEPISGQVIPEPQWILTMRAQAAKRGQGQ